jgi:hypothetical protein
MGLDSRNPSWNILQYKQNIVVRAADIGLCKGHCQAERIPKLVFPRNKPVSLYISLSFNFIGFALHDIYQILHFARTTPTYILGYSCSPSLSLHSSTSAQQTDTKI